MAKQKLPYIILLVSVVLIIVNIFTTDAYDNGFWMQTISSGLLAFAMIVTILNSKKSNK